MQCTVSVGLHAGESECSSIGMDVASGLKGLATWCCGLSSFRFGCSELSLFAVDACFYVGAGDGGDWMGAFVPQGGFALTIRVLVILYAGARGCSSDCEGQPNPIFRIFLKNAGDSR